MAAMMKEDDEEGDDDDEKADEDNEPEAEEIDEEEDSDSDESESEEETESESEPEVRPLVLISFMKLPVPDFCNQVKSSKSSKKNWRLTTCMISSLFFSVFNWISITKLRVKGPRDSNIS